MNFGGGYQDTGGFGGGGYDMGGYGGGGGGFMKSEVGISPSRQMEDKKKEPRNQSIIPVTGAIIQNAELIGDNDFVLDGVELGQVSLIGEVMSVTESRTNVSYKLDDRTGTYSDVKKWLDDQETEGEMNMRAECREGIIVRAIGHIRTFSGQRSLVAFSIRPIRDFNEITHHMVAVIHTQLALKKGMTVPVQFADNAITPAAGPGENTWGNPMSKPMANSTPASGYYGGGSYGSGMNQCQQQVLAAISACSLDQGISIHELLRKVGQQGMNERNIKSAVEFLCNEGHIYSTIDEEHFKSTDT